jgi:hypothetical protein
MSGFEFVLVLFAIIVGLGVSSILSGWGDQIRARHRVEVYPLQLALSAFVLLFSMIYLWSLWTFRDIVWTFPLYLLVATPGLVLSLVGYIIRVDTAEGAPPPKVQYFRNCGPAFLILSLIPLSVILFSFSSLRDSIADPPNLAAITSARLAIFAGIASLSWFRSERVHWAGVGLLVLVVVGLSIRLTVRAITDAA